MKQFEVDEYTIEPFLDGKIVKYKVLIKDKYVVLKKTWYTKELYDDIVRLLPDDGDAKHKEIVYKEIKNELASIL